MRTSAGYSMINAIKKLDDRLKQFKNIDMEKLYYYIYSWRIEEYIFNQLYTIDDRKKIKEFIEKMNDIKEIILAIINNKMYIEKINLIENEKDRKYIIERNNAFKLNKLEEYIIKSKNNFYRITPSFIYYGKN